MTVLIATMCLLEFFGGIESGSLALVSDALHMLSDGLSLVVALCCFLLSRRLNTPKMSFGWERMEVLGGLVNGVALVMVCMFIVVEAVDRLISPTKIEKPELVVIIGGVGLVFNIVGLFMFQQHGHGHAHGQAQGGHGHSHGGEDMNMKAIFLHILGDSLASISVIVSGLINLFTDWSFKTRVDPVVSLLISLMILSGTGPLVKRASLVLLQATPGEVNLDVLKKDILAVGGVVGVHHLHVWRLFKQKLLASVHINIGNQANYGEIIASVRIRLHNHGIHSSTIQPEPSEMGCSLNCGLECDKSSCCSSPLLGPAQHRGDGEDCCTVPLQEKSGGC